MSPSPCIATDLAEVPAAIARAVQAERQCCRFLRFPMIVGPGGGRVWLELSGSPGTGEATSTLLSS